MFSSFAVVVDIVMKITLKKMIVLKYSMNRRMPFFYMIIFDIVAVKQFLYSTKHDFYFVLFLNFHTYAHTKTIKISNLEVIA